MAIENAYPGFQMRRLSAFFALIVGTLILGIAGCAIAPAPLPTARQVVATPHRGEITTIVRRGGRQCDARAGIDRQWDRYSSHDRSEPDFCTKYDG